MGSLKRCGNIKPKESSKLRKNVDEKWNKANVKDMQANRLIGASCEGTYKKITHIIITFQSLCVADVNDEDNEGGFYPYSFPPPS